MPVDFTRLQELLDAAKKEADEATAAAEALAAVNAQLAAVQDQVSAAIAANAKEQEERVASLQAIIDEIQKGM